MFLGPSMAIAAQSATTTAAAGASTGVGAALGAALFNPLTIGFAAAGFGLAAFQAVQQNKEIKRRNNAIATSARSQMAAINENITSTRISFYDQTETASQQARQGIARAQNSLGWTSGISVDEYIAQQMADTNVDQLARQRALADYETQAEYQKESIAASASAGMQSGVSPLLSGLQGGLQGASIGSSLNNTVQSFQRAAEVNTALKTLGPAASAGDPTALAQIQAIQAGVPVAMAMQPGSPFIRSTLISNELQTLQLQAARQAYGTSSAVREQVGQQLFRANDDLLRYLP